MCLQGPYWVVMNSHLDHVNSPWHTVGAHSMIAILLYPVSTFENPHMLRKDRVVADY